ncbi:MAG: hypothetical protein FWG02_10370 [Holophagaceae bacterium]|nr:hypothetical protein [Holophagaceae bacterium]
MKILWDANNITHIARHGITPELAEKIVEAGWCGMYSGQYHDRYIMEATIDGRDYKLVCDIARDGTIYPVTAYPIRKRTSHGRPK